MEEQLKEESLRNIQEQKTISVTELPLKMAQDFVRLYGSVFSISSTPLDVSILIGQPIVDEPGGAYIQQRATITMSWQAAKTLAALVDVNVKNYEQQFGEIQLGTLQPPSF